MALSWIIAGGGTGGHVTPALALGEVIKERGEKLLFIGSQHGLEAKLVPDAGFELLALPSQQVMGRSLSGRIAGILRILSQVRAARRALLDRHADVVIAVTAALALYNPDTTPTDHATDGGCPTDGSTSSCITGAYHPTFAKRCSAMSSCARVNASKNGIMVLLQQKCALV